MSLLGLVALISCFLGGAGSVDAAVPVAWAEGHGVWSTNCGVPHQAALPGRWPSRPQSRPQANDSNDGGDDGSSADDLTASLDDDYHHMTALVWERLIVAASAALSTGSQWLTLENAAPNRLACAGNFNPAATSLRSLHVSLQI